ncbi:hypothetical protein [Undibacterium sp. Xuan67W]|uniref:hypothetical protein n=1 Tax=Undibacterium sp. Xuan67W TaxID=3413057 RepID=UPI003BF0AB14
MMLRHLTLLQDMTLSHDLQWVDEHSWSPVIANVEYSMTGALIVEAATRLAGRPITLQPPDESMAWHTRAIVDQLRLWCSQAGQTFLLTLDDGRSFNVMFRHQDSPAMESKPVRKMATYDPEDDWQVTLKLMEIMA